MRGFISLGALSLLATALVAPGVSAGEEELRTELQQLRSEVNTLKTTLLAEDVDRYLEESGTWRQAQGDDGMRNVTIHARFLTVFQGTVGQGSGSEDIGVVDGFVDVDFDFQVTDDLKLFVYTTANNGGTGSFPTNFSPTFVSFSPTLAGLSDGIGINGTVPTNPGALTVREAGIQSVLNLGDSQLHWEMGEIDPRDRFLQTQFTEDQNSGFIHNMFDDSSAVPWLTDSTGRTSLGWHMWLSFGENKQFTLNWGWFNTPGQWFANGQFYFQFHWKGEISGREMNLRIMGFWQEFFTNAVDDSTAGGGAAWDWWVAEDIGLFVKIATNGNDVNPVELDASVGVVFRGLASSRPDDTLGVAVGFTTANDTVLAGIAEDTEFTLEIYYKFMAQDGKMQITPHLIYVSDPGGGTPPFAEDSLFILGLRIFVPF